MVESETCRRAYKGPIILLYLLLSLSAISSVFGHVVPEWLNYHLLEGFSFFWFQTFMGENMTRLRCAPPKDKEFLEFLAF